MKREKRPLVGMGHTPLERFQEALLGAQAFFRSRKGSSARRAFDESEVSDMCMDVAASVSRSKKVDNAFGLGWVAAHRAVPDALRKRENRRKRERVWAESHGHRTYLDRDEQLCVDPRPGHVDELEWHEISEKLKGMSPFLLGKRRKRGDGRKDRYKQRELHKAFKRFVAGEGFSRDLPMRWRAEVRQAVRRIISGLARTG